MPWPEVLRMDLRRQFIDDVLRGGSMTELCHAYGISRKTGYKWFDRFEEGGRAALHDRSRRPASCPDSVPEHIVDALVRARRRKPYWGARKLRAWLRRTQPTMAWPPRSTIHTILKRRGVIRARRRRRHMPSLLTHRHTIARQPNDVWTADFKGSFRLRNGQRCYPFTLRDLASRYALRCDALTAESLRATQERCRRAFAEHGLPRCLRTDNGHPFASTGLARLSRLTVWWLRLGIHVERITPGHPQENGSHERFHRDLKAQTARPPAASFAAQQRRLKAFLHEYNEQRPHEALHDAVPADHYRASPRSLPARVPPILYPGHWEPRRVSTIGTIKWRNEQIFINTALAGETVALDEIDDGVWTLYFATVPLARWLEREQCFRPLRTD
jgi:putative transposase